MTDYSFYSLLDSYGWQVQEYSNAGPSVWEQNEFSYNITLAPFYVGVWGYTRLSMNNRLNGMGSAGYLWSKTPNSSKLLALDMGYWAYRTQVSPSQHGSDVERFVGFSLRCLTQ